MRRRNNLRGIVMKKRWAVFYLFIMMTLFLFPVSASANWQKTEKGNWVYVTSNGSRLKGWQTIDGKRYYFYPKNGVRYTRWKRVGQNYYYFGDDGVMRTGWQRVGKYTYYFGTNGVRAAGWTNIRNSKGKICRYYFIPKNGRMVTGFATISKKRYFFSPEGVLQYGWIRVNGKVYFGKNQTGQLAQNEWINLSDYSGRYNGYFFKSDASMAVNQWVSYRWVGSNGQYTGVTNKVGLVDEQNGTYFYNNSHRRVYNSFASAGGKRYYVNGAGQVVKNTWFSVGGRSYYAQEDGSLLVKKWKGKKYLGADGAMAVGWTKIGKYTCYFNSNGDAASGWMKINGEYYCFGAKGTIKKNAWVKTKGKYYRTDSNGKRVYGLCRVGNNYYYMGAKEGKCPGIRLGSWIVWNGVHYYANKKTNILNRDVFFKSGKYTYYAKPNCVLAQGITNIRGSVYYFDSRCRMVTGKLLTVNGATYYFGEDGKAQTSGSRVIGSNQYKFASNGKAVTIVPVSAGSSGWKTSGGKKYYYVNGVASTGWKTISGNTYYFTGAGVMVTGIEVIDGRKYYFYPTGIQAKNVTIAVGAKVYTLNKNGIVTAESNITVSGNTLGSKVAREAVKYIGNPYVYGGESLTGGTDCSGFTMLIYKKFGITMGHFAEWQRTGANCSKRPILVEANTASLMPGDLIFYGSSNYASHVAIYIGNGQIVHASNSRPYPAGGIKISTWNYMTPIRICRYWM